FMVIVLGLNYPLHGYLHTFLSALIVGLLLGVVMYKLEKPMQPLYKVTLLETDGTLGIKSFLLAGVFGTTLHVLFDAVLYSEMAPFFPWTINPLIGIGLSTVQVYSFCIGLGIIGIVYYVVTVVYSLFKKNHKKRNSQLRFKF
ncbi:MAG: hydrolase, partial [Candidatus Bathyarchaeota archaeon]|nr:hydrolase [Candidatus Bathyarchaeota archaeon]